MSRKYKFNNKGGVYFVSFATVYWLDVFTRRLYFDEIIASLDYCQKNKGLEIFAYCIMTNHIHLIFRAKESNPSDVLKAFKTFTSKQLQSKIESNIQESRKEYMLWMMERAGKNNSNVKFRQFWQQHNQPTEIYTSEVFEQKLDYIHKNPVETGFVTEPHYWQYSSAIDYSGGKGLLKLAEF
jgi:REP element-mobilizing transposase RayT